eukprot:SAG11_NODE_307_length_10982_cov_22.068823_3_plen_133_part_00
MVLNREKRARHRWGAAPADPPAAAIPSSPRLPTIHPVPVKSVTLSPEALAAEIAAAQAQRYRMLQPAPYAMTRAEETLLLKHRSQLSMARTHAARLGSSRHWTTNDLTIGFSFNHNDGTASGNDSRVFRMIR